MAELNIIDRKKVQKSFVHQHDSSDCGPACLLSLVRYYGGESSIMHLREISGTSNSGTTMLGLYQAAMAMGFNAQGAQAGGIEDLKEHSKPCILSVTIDKVLLHYVVCYGYENGHFIISDPARGLMEMDKDGLEKIWSRNCLLLAPNDMFVRKDVVSKKKLLWCKILIKNDLGILGASIAIGLVIAVLGMTMSVFSQKLIDEVLPSRNMTMLIAGSALVLILLLARVIISALRGRLMLMQCRNFNNRILHFFLSRLFHLPKCFFDRRKIGDMVARLGDTRRIQSVIGTIVGETIINMLVLLVAFGFLFMYSYRVALLALACMPGFFWIIFRSNNEIVSRQRAVMSSYAMSESGFIGAISGVSDIKSFSREETFLRYNSKLYSVFQDNAFSLGGLQIKIGLKAGICSSIIQIAVIAIGSIYVTNGAMSLGALMAVIGICSTLFPAIVNLALVMVPINEAKVAFERMYEVIDTQKEGDNVPMPKPTACNVLEIKGIGFRFVGSKKLLSGLTANFRRGTISCVVGESGCGKSTLCALIERFYEPEEGKILIDGLPASQYSISQWRDLMSVVHQEVFIVSGTILDNICFGTMPRDIGEVVSFCAEYGFDKFIAEFPNGLSTMVGESGINLSGGQKQMVAFMRALYKPCQILLLDEATSAMDRQREGNICKLLQAIKKDHIIIFITHRLETARRIGDSIIVMDDGAICASGTHEDLMRSSNFYSEYWREPR